MKRSILIWSVGLTGLLWAASYVTGLPAKGEATNINSKLALAPEATMGLDRQSLPRPAPKKASTITHLNARGELTASGSDPFFLTAPVTPPATRVIPPVVISVSPQAPAQVIQAPSFPYQLFGRLQNQEGRAIVYLTLDDRLVPIESGTQLQNGYKVKSVTMAEILVSHETTKQEVRMTFPKQVN